MLLRAAFAARERLAACRSFAAFHFSESRGTPKALNRPLRIFDSFGATGLEIAFVWLEHTASALVARDPGVKAEQQQNSQQKPWCLAPGAETEKTTEDEN